MEENSLIKYESRQLQKVGNTIAITDRLLSLYEPQLIPYLKQDKWGFCTPDKKIIIDCIYEDIQPFSQGIAKVKLNNKYGFIDKTGKLIIDCVYDYVWWGFCDGLASVGKIADNTSHIINLEGIKINKVPYWYSRSPIHEDLIMIEREGKTGFLNKSGELYIDFLYKAARDFNEGYAPVSIDKKNWGFIDKEGNKIIDFIYSWASYGFVEGLAGVAYKNKFGFINSKGEMLIQNKFEQVYCFSEGLALVEFHKKNGFINRKGEFVIDCIYDTAFNFSEDLACVKMKDKFGFINNTGELVIDFIYDFNAAISNFSEGMAGVQLSGKSGYINTKGDVVIPCKYEYVNSFKNGIAKVCEFKSAKKRYINKDGLEYWED